MCFLFFLQAEDGIRDGHVTGVQTCALPISPGWIKVTSKKEIIQDKIIVKPANVMNSMNGSGSLFPTRSMLFKKRLTFDFFDVVVCEDMRFTPFETSFFYNPYRNNKLYRLNLSSKCS